jgi:hypothetical protein
VAHTKITEDKFVSMFRPEPLPDGGLYVQRDASDPADWGLIKNADRENRCWTMVETDGVQEIAQGFHLVNRLYCILCEVPYADGDTIEIAIDSDWDD